MTTAPMTLILASASPRRQALLARLGLPFAIEPSGIDEVVEPGVPPEVVVRHLARAKAEQVAAGRPGRLVLGCDTIVLLDGDMLGKPADAAEAQTMLRLLRGRSHRVLTGLALVMAGDARAITSVVTSTVSLAEIDDAEIARYVATGEPLDKAGSYAAQGEGARLISRIDGCYTNVVGLPLCELARLLRLAGPAIPAWPPVCAFPDGRTCPRVGHR